VTCSSVWPSASDSCRARSRCIRHTVLPSYILEQCELIALMRRRCQKRRDPSAQRSRLECTLRFARTQSPVESMRSSLPAHRRTVTAETTPQPKQEGSKNTGRSRKYPSPLAHVCATSPRSRGALHACSPVIATLCCVAHFDQSTYRSASMRRQRVLTVTRITPGPTTKRDYRQYSATLMTAQHRWATRETVSALCILALSCFCRLPGNAP